MTCCHNENRRVVIQSKMLRVTTASSAIPLFRPVVIFYSVLQNVSALLPFQMIVCYTLYGVFNISIACAMCISCSPPHL